MKKDNEKTDVIFRIARIDGTVEAFFPYMISDYKGNITVYAHLGQHGQACWEYYLRNTKPAKEKDYTSLKRELDSLGYNLNVIKRRNFRRYSSAFDKAIL